MFALKQDAEQSLWESWLHKDFSASSFDEFKEEVHKRAVTSQPISDKQKESIITEALSIVDDFALSMK